MNARRCERRPRRSPLALLLLLAGALAPLACRGTEVVSPQPEDSEEPVMAVETARVRRGPIVSRVVVSGSLVARRTSQIGPRLPGRIARLHVHVGDRVAEGDVLFEIESSSTAAVLSQARAGRDVARAERRQLAEDLAAQEKLLEDELVAEQRVAHLRTQLEVARAHERQAARAVEIAQRDLADATVRAPYAGSISRRLADEGTTVTPQTTVVELQETAWLEARAAVAESHLDLVHVGDRVRIHVQGRSQPIESEVSAVSDTIDPATRTYLVRIVVSNHRRELKAGVLAKIEITPAALSDVLMIPRSAIDVVDGRSLVFRVREGRVESVAIETGIVTEEAAVIVDGLAPGDVVVVGDAARLLVPGMKVESAEAASAGRGRAT
ncbi:MAG: efflux RND transporter periplasmic adaptor subunit [Myxococcota bacterium]